MTSESTALQPHMPTPEEIEASATAIMASGESKFLSDRQLSRNDDDQAKLRLLVAFSIREGLNPYAGEVMLFQGKPYKTLPGVITQGRRGGRIDFGPHEEIVSEQEQERIQSQIPPAPDTGETDRAYIAKVRIKLRGSTEPQTHFSYVLESERRQAMDSEKHSRNQQTRDNAAKGQFRQPIIKHTQKLALARAKRKALIDSGAASADDMNELDRIAAISEIQAFGLTSATGTEPRLEAGEEPLPFEPPAAELTAGETDPATEATAAVDHTSATAAAEPDPEGDEVEWPEETAVETTAETVDKPESPEGPAPWEPPDDFQVLEHDSHDDTVVRYAASIGYTQKTLAFALLMPSVRKQAVNLLCERWSVRAVCYALQRLAGQVAALSDMADMNDPRFGELALAYHENRRMEGDGFYNDEVLEAQA